MGSTSAQLTDFQTTFLHEFLCPDPLAATYPQYKLLVSLTEANTALELEALIDMVGLLNTTRFVDCPIVLFYILAMKIASD